jgi:hypothetical protein
MPLQRQGRYITRSGDHIFLPGQACWRSAKDGAFHILIPHEQVFFSILVQFLESNQF